MNAKGLMALLCVVALGALLVPRGAGAIDYNLAGSAQLDYFYVPFSGSDPRPATQAIDGFTEELSLKLALDFSSHVSANVKVCYGCHGFEMAMGFADLRLNDEFNVRVGRFNPTFGEFQLRYDVANHRTSDRPLPYDMGRMLYLFQFNRSVLPLPYVETGIEISGSHFFGTHVQIDYAAHAVAGLRSPVTNPYDVDFTLSHGASPFQVDNNSQPSVGGRIGATFRLAERVDLTLGASGIWGAYDPQANYHYAILGVDAYLRLGRTSVRAEYLIRRTEMAPTNAYEFPVSRNMDGSVMADSLFNIKDGFYLEFEQPVNRYLEVVLRWDGIHRRGNEAPGSTLSFDAGMLRYTAGANFIIERGYRIKASAELYQIWGVQNAPTLVPGFHLSAVAAF